MRSAIPRVEQRARAATTMATKPPTYTALAKTRTPSSAASAVRGFANTAMVAFLAANSRGLGWLKHRLDCNLGADEQP
jgi:hypothetical protein